MVKKLKEVRVGDYIRVTRPWFINGRQTNSSKEEVEAVKGAIGIVENIDKTKSNDLPYIVKIIYINKKIHKINPAFRGAIWNKTEFEVITKEEAFLYIL